MDPTEISLLLLRHLAKEGCKDTIKIYMTECASVKQLTGADGDVELFRQKLLNRSLTLSLTDLLHEYARAKSIIQELVSKLLYDWKALSTLFVSPHDSIATQLAHISQLLETKCKQVPMETKCVGTSDDVDILQFVDSSVSMITNCLKIDAEVQTAAADEVVEGPAGDEDLPNIVESLMAPQNLDKMVEMANRELNRSSQSATETALANDTEVEIDQMLLDILHGACPDANIPTTALNEGLHRSQVPPCASTSGAQLLEIFQDVQNVIADTPITGTLGNPEDSVSKQLKHYTSCLDLIETPCKFAFAQLMTTPLPKTTTFDPEPPEKLPNLKTVTLDFGPTQAVNQQAASTSLLPPDPVQEQIALARIRQHNGPRYSVVQQQQSSSGRPEIDRLRKKRDITPRIPVTTKPENDGQSSLSSSSTVALLRSASKRKFTTPVKISPGKALMTSVNFYCPSTSLHEKSSSTPSNKDQDPIETPHKEASSVCGSEPSTSTLLAPSPLVTINYKDLFDASAGKHIDAPTLPSKPQVSFKDQNDKKDDPPVELPMEVSSLASDTNMTTPDNRKEEQQQPSDDNLSSLTPHMYNRLLASVRHARPVTIVNKKSFSTPRKKGHIRNLLFKTPPGTQQQDKLKLSNVSEEESGSLKRKLSPPLGNKSKKRLKWTNLVKNSDPDKSVSTPPKKVSYEPISPVAPSAPPTSNHPTPPNLNQAAPHPNQAAPHLNQVVPQPNKAPPPQARSSQQFQISMTEVASKVLTQTRTRSTNQNKKIVEQEGPEAKNKSDKLPPLALEMSDAAKNFQTPAPSGSNNRRRRSKRMEDLMAAEAAVNAIPLGNRGNTEQQQDRFARKTRSATKNSPEVVRSQTIPPEVAGPSVVQPPLRSPVKDSPMTRSSCGTSPSGSVPNIQVVKEVEVQQAATTSKPKKESRAIFHPRTRQAKATALQSLAQSLEMSRQGPLNPTPKPPEIELRPQEVQPIPQEVPFSSTRLASVQLAKTFPHWSASLEQSSKEQSDQGKSTTDSGKSSTNSSSASTSSSSLGNSSLKSPGWDGGRSPMNKTPHKNTPRRILPKPVPPDHPVPPVFPPPLPATSYVLSIPSDTPSKDKSDIFKSVNVEPDQEVASTNFDRFPQLSCSSDSSTEISVTSTSPVPMTPRLKPDPGEESSMHTRLFPDSSASGLGAPIFSSTPLKFPSIPATPGKNILNTMNPPVLNESGECSQGSLFDTPLKANLPPPPPPPVMVKATAMKTPPRPTAPVRKSPRKVKTPVKKQKVTPPKKVKTPVKSTNVASKSSKKTPKVPLKSSSPSVERNERGSSGSTVPKKSPNKVPQDTKTSTSFLSVCTKSKSFMRLAEIARRGRDNSTTPAPAPLAPKILQVREELPPPPAASLSDKDKDAGLAKEKDAGLAKEKDTGLAKEKDAGLAKGKAVSIAIAKENNLESNKKGPEAHFQFSVSGRAKQLSLSEHETLLGLLQMSSVNTQPPPPQKPEANVLSGIDVLQFLKKVHRGD